MRNFQRHYYNTTSDTYGELYTSITEVELLNPENRMNKFNPKKNCYRINTAIKIADIINYFDLDIVAHNEKLLNKHIDTHYLFDLFGCYEPLGNITISEVEYIVLDTIKGKLSEPFSVRKDTCDYKNNFKLKITDGTNQIECLVEWNYERECYRFKKEDMNFMICNQKGTS